MVGARLQSKITNSTERVKSMQHMYALERISKQKNLMKYIREQLRLSDFRRVIDKISKMGRDSLDEIDLQRRELLAASQPSVNQNLPDNNRVRALLVQLMKVAEQLSATALYNGQDDSGTNNDDVPVGSLELRIPDSQVDDETLHGLVGLLVGALGSANGHNGEVLQGEGVSKGDAFRQSDIMMGDGLGIELSGARLSAATQIAKTFLTVQSNYSDRILLLNIKDNLLSDISCKILSGLVEKTTSLRMLDLRGNMISPVGAKMLFDATRRNQSVMYVTQRQNGFMIEGHREIMGSVQQRVHRNDRDEQKHGDNSDEYISEIKSTKDSGKDIKKKHPLRIDMRNNNPEQEAIEKLLESNEYTSRTGIREKYSNNLVNDSQHHKSQLSDIFGTSKKSVDRSATANRRRPKSAVMSTQSNENVKGAGLTRSFGYGDSTRSDSYALNQPTDRDRGIKSKQSLLPQVGDSDNSDEDYETNEIKEPRDPKKMTEIEKRLAAKENERIIGLRTKDGEAGVGSLLDKEIRHMQERVDDKAIPKTTTNKTPNNKRRDLLNRPKSATVSTRSSRSVRKSRALNKSSSDGYMLKKKKGNKTPQKGIVGPEPSSATKNGKNGSNAYFHLNPAVLF